jgi:hypothetical protein
MRQLLPTLTPLLLSLLAWHSAFALITGGKGNEPIPNPGWPEGAEKIFNHEARIAYWVGPPFGGGQWHAEYRGDTKTLNDLLADFARLDVKSKTIVVHDGVGRSYWLNPNREPEKKDAARMDWSFMVWQPENWERLRKLPPEFSPVAGSKEDSPPSQIEIYTGGNIQWGEVKIPEGIKVIDQRLEAHGFKPADGIVLEGIATDAEAKLPIAGARMRLERVEPQKVGGYHYEPVATAQADEAGRWVLTKAPAGWHRIIVEADGYAPRIAGHGRFDEEPRWHSYNNSMSRIAKVTGNVFDDEEKPLAEVTVRLTGIVSHDGSNYELPGNASVVTDARGYFEFDNVPIGKARATVHKQGYVRPGLGLPVELPGEGVSLNMTRSAELKVTVDFSDMPRPEAYIVHVRPEEGEEVGSWGGSGNIDADNQITFRNIPPGKYVVQGMPNPGSEKEKSRPITVDLKAGEVNGITISRRPAS